jgi:DNA-binding CsgD family transcriptional regulator
LNLRVIEAAAAPFAPAPKPHELLAMWEAGASIGQLARLTQRHPQTVWAAIQRARRRTGR